ncbi:nitroreductase [Asanoa sp. WMMD1127]|uniref:Acg family FMN-binding oxidoreductase n=1 Tax=Asanoa sp. WMMD1127 TaxID=3016107 RepID=UPI0024171DDF|nr:nitroreductase [Asanoa sp. WMMD1127]MDG4825341.1 nitroreductase [Asanoa sp. WMMD1127]
MEHNGYGPAELSAAVELAVRAPSMHNSQPWRFGLAGGAIEVLVDPARLPAIPARDWAGLVSCGAAVFNLRLALAALGRPAVAVVRPSGDAALVARLVPDAPRPPSGAERALCAAIPRRHSNRAPFSTAKVPADLRFRLREAARAEGGWLDLIIGTSAVDALAEVVNAANRVLRRDEAYADELARWRRDTISPDGVPVRAAGYAPEPQDLLPMRAFGGRTRPPGRDYEPEPLVAVLGTATDGPADQVTAGQALQRVLLTATDAGLAVSLFSQPIEVPVARERLRSALGRQGVPQMVLRVGYGHPGQPSLRRPAAAVID